MSGARDRIREAALELFKARGYHGASMRDIAEAVRIKAASLYNHFPSKQSILVEIFDSVLDAMLAEFERIEAAGGTAAERLRAFVRFHVLFHIARQGQAFVSHSELRSLDPENRQRIMAKRDRYERMLRDLLSEGVREGAFEIDDVRITGIAILMMCSGVSDWFARAGRLSDRDVAERHADMVLRLVERPRDGRRLAVAAPSPARRRSR